MRNARGIAQLVVLWTLLLVGGLAMSFASSMRTEAQAARNGVDAARAYFQARTGISRAIAALSAVPMDDVLATEIAGGDGDASYAVDVQAEGGRLDVNFVSEAVLKEVLRNGGLDAAEAEAVGDSILAWRDGSRAIRAHGATEADYAALPEPVRPRYGRLASVEELRSVRGVSPGFYRRCLAKVFTVYGRSPQVDLATAPAEVLAVLPGFTPGLAAEVVARRKDGSLRGPAEAISFLAERNIPASLFVLGAAGGTGVVTLTSTGTAGGAVARVVRCTVEVGRGGDKAVRILRWADNAAGGESE